MEPVSKPVPLATGGKQIHLPLSAIPANVLSQLQEVPSNVSSARIFRLPPGVVLVKQAGGQILSATNPGTPVSAQPVLQWPSVKPAQASALTSEVPISTTQGFVPKTNDNNARSVVLLKTPAGKILSTVSQAAPVSAQSVLKLQFVPPPLTPAPPSYIKQVTAEQTVQKEPSIVQAVSSPRVVQSRVPNAKEPEPDDPSKPKPWWREPRPIWKSKEPIVLYSGCKPENLEPKKKKEEPPKSLPCPQKLDDILPKSWQYHISSFEELQNPDKFKAEVRTTITTKEDALQWIQDFEAISGTNFRVTKTFKENSFRIVFKKCFKCHKNSCRKDKVLKRQSGRNLGCEARLSVTIKKPEMKWSTDLLLAQYPCVIGILHNHCHPLTADALRHRRPLPELREKFSNMFKARITPSAARRLHLQDLKREYGDKYADVIQDGARCPPLPWCYRLYYEIVGRKVKDGRKKSNRRSYYKKKTSILSRNPGQTERAPVIVDFSSENVIGDSFPASGLNVKRECEEIQRSINSLYEYDFMSKSGEAREDELENNVTVANDAETNAVLSDNVQVDHVMDNSELLNSQGDASNDDYIDNTDMLDNAECVGEFVTSGEILNADATTSNDDVEMTDQALNDLTCTEGHQNEDLEMAKQNLNNVFNDLNTRLLNDPQKYLSAVNHFISQYDESQASSESALVTALLEFGSPKTPTPKDVPSNLENSVSTIVEKYLVKKQTPASSRKSENSVSPKRKVLVLRMDPNKFNQIMGRVGKSSSKNVINI